MTPPTGAQLAAAVHAFEDFLFTDDDVQAALADCLDLSGYQASGEDEAFEATSAVWAAVARRIVAAVGAPR